jgi:hypothetical protein
LLKVTLNTITITPKSIAVDLLGHVWVFHMWVVCRDSHLTRWVSVIILNIIPDNILLL